MAFPADADHRLPGTPALGRICPGPSSLRVLYSRCIASGNRREPDSTRPRQKHAVRSTQRRSDRHVEKVELVESRGEFPKFVVGESDSAQVLRLPGRTRGCLMRWVPLRHSAENELARGDLAIHHVHRARAA